MIALGCIATVVVLATCGLGGYLVVRDDQQVVGAEPTPTEAVPQRDISNRTADPSLLTIADVFPDKEIIADPAFPPYTMSGQAQILKDCRAGATGEVGKLLRQLGCNQVVRATFKSPDGGYWATAGIFNLKDRDAAVQAHEQIRSLVDAEEGRFTGYVSGTATRVLGRAPTQLAWDAQGHFLVYCVIARADGKEFEESDPHLRVIIYDLAEKYLRDHVLSQWAIDRSSPQPAEPAGSSADPSPGASAAG
jgi:hypothetical protein